MCLCFNVRSLFLFHHIPKEQEKRYTPVLRTFFLYHTLLSNGRAMFSLRVYKLYPPPKKSIMKRKGTILMSCYLYAWFKWAIGKTHKLAGLTLHAPSTVSKLGCFTSPLSCLHQASILLWEATTPCSLRGKPPKRTVFQLQPVYTSVFLEMRLFPMTPKNSLHANEDNILIIRWISFYFASPAYPLAGETQRYQKSKNGLAQQSAASPAAMGLRKN